ncbi:MAG: type II toxin-antitoxin system RelE/ParE family toxin [Acidobacteriaceae bacterium]|nr:type II toxin-antitoxin system RelE/ParE family toxin [Acidobacteriaceae bacterium]
MRSSRGAIAYVVNLTARAERDLEYLYFEINAAHSIPALEWYRGLKQAILTLQARPNRCPVTPEDPRLRHLLYGKRPHVYRVIYRVVRGKRVEVLHFRHGARRRFTRPDMA